MRNLVVFIVLIALLGLGLKIFPLLQKEIMYYEFLRSPYEAKGGGVYLYS
jgi:hypothetical protein